MCSVLYKQGNLRFPQRLCKPAVKTDKQNGGMNTVRAHRHFFLGFCYVCFVYWCYSSFICLRGDNLFFFLPHFAWLILSMFRTLLTFFFVLMFIWLVSFLYALCIAFCFPFLIFFYFFLPKHFPFRFSYKVWFLSFLFPFILVAIPNL